MKSIDFAVTRFPMKLFRTSNTEIIAECQRYFGFSLPSGLREKKRNEFVNNYDNVIILPRCMEYQRRLATRKLSVCLSVCQTRGLCQNGRKIYLDFYTIRKIV